MCLRSVLSLLQRVTSRPSLTGREDRAAAACGYPQSIYIWSQWWEVCSFFSIYIWATWGDLNTEVWGAVTSHKSLHQQLLICFEGGRWWRSRRPDRMQRPWRLCDRKMGKNSTVFLRTRDLWGETHHQAPRFVQVIYFTQHANEGLSERC